MKVWEFWKRKGAKAEDGSRYNSVDVYVDVDGKMVSLKELVAYMRAEAIEKQVMAEQMSIVNSGTVDAPEMVIKTVGMALTIPAGEYKRDELIANYRRLNTADAEKKDEGTADKDEKKTEEKKENEDGKKDEEKKKENSADAASAADEAAAAQAASDAAAAAAAQKKDEDQSHFERLNSAAQGAALEVPEIITKEDRIQRGKDLYGSGKKA